MTAVRNDAKSLAVHQRIIQHSLEMANLKPNQCRWPIGDPDSEHFHFCGETVFVGKPYCYEHCKQAYQFAPPKKKWRAPPTTGSKKTKCMRACAPLQTKARYGPS